MKKLYLLLPCMLLCAGFICTPRTEVREETQAPPAQTEPQQEFDIEPTDRAIELLGREFFDKDGNQYDERVLGAGIIGIYFSASWCPPCRNFTPQLVNAYNKIKSDGNTFEIIFVSSDRSDDDKFKYMKDYNMDWYAISRNSPFVDRLMQNYTIRGIPSLIIIDVDGNTLSSNGVGEVSGSGAGAYDRWLRAAGF